jgi:hypothetical protein
LEGCIGWLMPESRSRVTGLVTWIWSQRRDDADRRHDG